MFFIYKSFMNPMFCKHLLPVCILPLLPFGEEPFDEKDLI